jgi:hypothetical protein
MSSIGKRMEQVTIEQWLNRHKIRSILHEFSLPNQPSRVEQKLNIKKLKMKPFLENNIVKPLNPNARKGRLYQLTPKVQRLLNVCKKSRYNIDWQVPGWILASPKQRLAILKSLDLVKRHSEDIRKRTSRYNPNFTRISTKQILKELITKKLVETEMGKDGKRYYWISHTGKKVMEDMLINDVNKK